MLESSDIHVFTALFATKDEASTFGHPHWEPEPSQDASEEEYTAWEDRNPIWPMKSELSCSIDNDFVEIIWKSGKEPDWDYLVRGWTTRRWPRSDARRRRRIPLS